MEDDKVIIVQLTRVEGKVDGVNKRLDRMNNKIEEHEKELVKQGNVDTKVLTLMESYPARFKNLDKKVNKFQGISFKVKMIWVILGAGGFLLLEIVKDLIFNEVLFP